MSNPITLAVFKKQNDTLKKKKLPCVRLEKVNLKEGIALASYGTYPISEYVNSVMAGKFYISNPSVIEKWKGWDEAAKQENKRNTFIRELQEYHRTPPTYTFAVGDKVSVGALRDPVVAEVLADGKGYVIDFTSVDNNYGKPIVTPHCKRFFAWTDIRPLNQNTKSFIKASDNMRLSYCQRQLSGLINMIYNFGVDFEPPYQRGFVWTNEDKVRLIDSIFHGVDIGKFVFIHTDSYSYGSYGYEILDGKQRLKTLQEFYENRFAYNGCYYNDLSQRDKNFFENYNISYAEVKNMTNADKYRLFVFLNTSGHVMEQKHLEYVKQLYAKETGSILE